MNMGKALALWILCLSILGACRGEGTTDEPAAERTSPSADVTPATSLTPTEYATSVLFLSTEARLAPSLVMQFSNTATPDGLQRHYTIWLLGRSGWRTVLDAEWEDGPMRAPWRLFPGESLRLTVTPDGDPDALIFPVGSSDYMLDLGARLDGWEDRAGTRHEIRAAQLIRRGQTVTGITLEHRFAIPEPRRPARFGPHERAILRADDGSLIVLFHSASPETYGDSFAWVYAEGLTRRWAALETRAVEVVSSQQLRRNIPIRSWFHILEPDIKGELTATARAVDELPSDRGPQPYHAVYRVGGWIEFGGERQDVEGVLERGEP